MTRWIPEQQLAPGYVHLWVADLTNLAHADVGLDGLLCGEERDRAARFVFERDRRRFVTGRALLRALLAQYTGAPARELRLQPGTHGKPALAAPGSTVQFNLSHSGDFVLLAFGCNGEIGVDVERLRTDVDCAALAPACFSAPERDDIFAVEAESRDRFFHYWAAKESWIKADGRGLTIPLDRYSIRPDTRRRTYLVLDPAGRVLPWRIHAVVLERGYACAVTVPALPAPARILRFDVTTWMLREAAERDAALHPHPARGGQPFSIQHGTCV